MMDSRCHAEDLVSPGHVFPACAEPDGVLLRPGWAEVGVDLARIAGVQPAATFCRVLDDSGEVAHADTLIARAESLALPHLTLADLVAHRMATESFVTQLSQSALRVGAGEFVTRAFEDRLTKRQHLALSLGDVRSPEPILVRLHSECLTGDVFGSRRCDCGQQLNEALARVQSEGRGLVLYLRQEGRGIGLVNKVRAYQLQDQGRDTVEANEDLGLPVDPRDYGVAAQMLLALGARRVRLMTNNPKKIEGLEIHGVEVISREPIEIPPSEDNHHYLATKKAKMGHLLDTV
ncbi:MAG: GTP cyclohydrolase II [Proteobacteria bacterium]|nr:MAG: GTP cyclohydrolase II [Pseudomonadota bacterium]